jgi:ABC-2 type transport system ATP-binding protein
MSKEIAIEVKNLSKHFRLPVEQARGIKQAVINRFKGIKGYKDQKVLRDISFNVEKGDFFGIVGRNGSGKSTLLKLISNIYNSDSGTVAINGSLVSFIELGVGFNPELTGRENVYLNGALLGFSTSEVDEMYDDIVDFAELAEFMDQKLKIYSSGMQVRLAFSCAIRAKSDILVLDEVLAVGDEAFQRKCNDYFDKIRKEDGKTVVLVTHNMGAVRKYCNRALMLRDGKIVVVGSPEDVANEYSLENLETNDVLNPDKSHKERALFIKNLDVKMMNKKIVSEKDKVKIRISYEAKEHTKTSIKLSMIEMSSGAMALWSSSELFDKKKVTSTLTIDMSNLNDANFKIFVNIRNENGDLLSGLQDSLAPTFVFRRADYDSKQNVSPAVLFSQGEWME